MAAQGAKAKPDKSALRPQIRIMFRKAIAMGPGKADLLEAIAGTGSISAAARKLGMSYRRAWVLVNTMNQCFDRPLVETATGGSHGGPILRMEASPTTTSTIFRTRVQTLSCT